MGTAPIKVHYYYYYYYGDEAGNAFHPHVSPPLHSLWTMPCCPLDTLPLMTWSQYVAPLWFSFEHPDPLHADWITSARTVWSDSRRAPEIAWTVDDAEGERFLRWWKQMKRSWPTVVTLGLVFQSEAGLSPVLLVCWNRFHSLLVVLCMTPRCLATDAWLWAACGRPIAWSRCCCRKRGRFQTAVLFAEDKAKDEINVPIALGAWEDKQTSSHVLYPLVSEHSRHLTACLLQNSCSVRILRLTNAKSASRSLLRTCGTAGVNSGLGSVEWITVDSSTVLQIFYVQLNRYATSLGKMRFFFWTVY